MDTRPDCRVSIVSPACIVDPLARFEGCGSLIGHRCVGTLLPTRTTEPTNDVRAQLPRLGAWAPVLAVATSIAIATRLAHMPRLLEAQPARCGQIRGATTGAAAGLDTSRE